jgi:hypothetical protein
MNYVIIIENLGSVRGVEKALGTKRGGGGAKPGSRSSTKDLKYPQSGNKIDDEQEKSGEFRKVSNPRCQI